VVRIAIVPEALKKEIKAKNDIVDVISEYMQLIRQGNLWVGLCPFPHGGTDNEPHFESDPSFTIYENQSFYCYSCCKGNKEDGNAGSDVIAFIMEMEGLGYIDACRHLAERAGIPFSLARNEDGNLSGKINQVTNTNREFYINLWSNNYELAQQIARERGIDANWLQTNARLGLVPENYYWEVARGRFCIGIPEMSKVKNPRTIGMAYRHPDGRSPKWINDSGSTAFSKSNTLYYFPYAYKHIRKCRSAIVMEGYMDVLSAHYHTLTNTVGIMGSQFTDEQMNILRKETDTLYLWPDGDIAGTAIVEKSLPKLLEKGFKVIWVQTPGKDPDEIMFGKTPDEVRYIIQNQSIPALLGIIQKYKQDIDLAAGWTNPDMLDMMRTECLDKLILLLKAIRRSGELVLYMEKVASIFGVASNNLLGLLNSLDTHKEMIK